MPGDTAKHRDLQGKGSSLFTHRFPHQVSLDTQVEPVKLSGTPRGRHKRKNSKRTGAHFGPRKAGDTWEANGHFSVSKSHPIVVVILLAGSAEAFDREMLCLVLHRGVIVTGHLCGEAVAAAGAQIVLHIHGVYLLFTRDLDNHPDVL